MRTCKEWMASHRTRHARPHTESSYFLKPIIKKEMQCAPGCDVLKFKYDLLAKNLKDMFSVEELSYMAYMQLTSILKQEYARSLEKLNKGERRKGSTK